MEFLQTIWHNAMTYYNNQSWNTGLSILAMIYLATFYIDRLICLDKCLKEDALPRDIRQAQIVLLIVFIWCVICFLVLRFAVGLSFILCLLSFLIGWGLITLLFGRRILKKVEDPEKKRGHFYGIWVQKK